MRTPIGHTKALVACEDALLGLASLAGELNG